ncbi:hypothetical protein TNCV_3268721 [Trichonephila clavipes]|nr:hypothetical protein TNCV_3268721 [Trichonephila clavipes]
MLVRAYEDHEMCVRLARRDSVSNKPVAEDRQSLSVLKILRNNSRAFGDGPRNFEPLWTAPELAPPSPNYHYTNGRAFELSTDLACIAPLHGGSSEVLGSNS